MNPTIVLNDVRLTPDEIYKSAFSAYFSRLGWSQAIVAFCILLPVVSTALAKPENRGLVVEKYKILIIIDILWLWLALMVPYS
jgi:hypothetical protein